MFLNTNPAGRGFFLRMKKIILLLIIPLTFLISGCASSDSIQDEKEFSDMPWNTPQQWEGQKQMPGIGGMPGQRGY